jgi:multicomponent Na+:H+ antiporter subunit G
MNVFGVIGDIIITAGIILILFGVYSIYRFDHFYSRILVSSKVDIVGFITIMTGMIIKSGFSFFSLNVLIIIALAVITGPLSTHSIARSAYLSGHSIKNERDKKQIP